MKNLAFLFLLSLMPLFSFADLVTEGEVSHRFTILNIDDYPDYRFYILRQSYRYDRGYQPAGTSQVPVEAGKYLEAGERSYQSLLFAQRGENLSDVCESTIRLGGREVVADPKAEYIKDDYRIVSINDSAIVLELVASTLKLRGGKEVKMDKGGLSTGVEVGGIDLIYFALPLVCLFGIVFFFIYRRRKSRSENT